ncbi:hypothetical protein AvCA_24620 [Azotobacter vinelandii CA]|uniref:Nucleotidyltransferase family protein n=2 Tax=Azotobacter vinelandii TaxID=354 RepID=C1DIG4_AZOVD|nr:hypothetical protein Avin_24620 [Azotobacter vinelandii DJ]AGK14954.1 hypothetical protein AvCA_24620 [Azotobacter vinelandii CA]AGK20624.1 hypothetical protein AvCA6_24620 [Azotobacter vinelandii CA6]GLK61746.1 hypothetical protein GCM10017624_39100 [Azotobacter vinelandii]
MCEARVIVDTRINLLMLALSAGMMSIDEGESVVYADNLVRAIDKTWLNKNQNTVVQFMHKTKMMSFADSLFPFVQECQLFKLVELYNALVEVTAIRRSMLEPVFTALNESRIDVMPYKGIDFIYNYQSASAHRFISDVDLIIRRNQLSCAASVFEGMGFVQAQVSKGQLSVDGQSLHMLPWVLSDAMGVAWNEQSVRPYVKVGKAEVLQPYQEILSEYTMIYQSGQPMVIAYIDLEFSVMPGIDERDVWHRTRVTKIADEVCSGLCPELYLCSLFCRVCTVSDVFDAPSVYPFVDALRVLVAGGIDWDYLWVMADRYYLVVPISQCLIELVAIAGSAIPAEVFSRCQKNLIIHGASSKPTLLEWLSVIKGIL